MIIDNEVELAYVGLMFERLRTWYLCTLRGQHDWRQHWRETWDNRLIPNGRLTCMRCETVIDVDGMGVEDEHELQDKARARWSRTKARFKIID